jgi:hypothetical protein
MGDSGYEWAVFFRSLTLRAWRPRVKLFIFFNR